MLKLMVLAIACQAADGLTGPLRSHVDDPLTQALEAMTAAPCVTYDFTFRGTGSLAAHLPTIEGHASLRRALQGEVHAMAIDATVTLPSGIPIQQPPMRLRVATDGREIRSMLGEAPTMFISPADGAGRVLLEFLQYGVMEAFLDPDSMKKGWTAGDGLPREVEGVMCEEVMILDEQGRRVAYAFGVDDHLPRARTFMDPGVAADGGVELVLRHVTQEMALPDALFRPDPPEGYALDADGAWLPTGSPAPPWTLKDSNGAEVSLSDLRGRVVVMEVWASWCGACRLSLPALDGVHRHFAGKPVDVLAVSLLEQDENDPVAHVQERGYGFRVLTGGESIAPSYVFRGLPTLYVIDRHGVVVYAGGGFDPDREATLIEAVEKALQEKLPERP